MKHPIKYLAISFCAAVLVSQSACTPEEVTQVVDTLYGLGWQQTDNVQTVPVTTSYGLPDANNLPASVDLTPQFPPIGNQGRYGTCVAWAAGYNMMTAIKGMKSSLNSTQLASAANQMSPRDLFTAIPDNLKGSNCNGTNFESALDIMQTRGIATMQTAPYGTSLDCSRSNVQTSWTNEAANNKIKYWRKIDPTVTTIKQHLANNIPVLIGAKLSDNFMTWNSDAVLSSNTTYNQVGQHAGHALIISGYDNSKGANGAFKVINSWGSSWGSRGYIWVDYDFMVNQFVLASGGGKPIFIAAVDGGNTPPVVNPNAGGADLATWVNADASTGTATQRVIHYDIFNTGTVAAQSNKEWDIFYIYYNAYDSEDYGLIFYNEFNTSIAQNTYDCSGNNCTINYNIAANNGKLSTAFGFPNGIYQSYNMPTNVTGQYYLLMVADATDKFAEKDEENNFFYTTDDPISFQNGQAARGNAGSWGFQNTLKAIPANIQRNPHNTAVNERHHNAYTPEEIGTLLKNEHKSGRLQRKIQEFLKNRQKNSGIQSHQ